MFGLEIVTFYLKTIENCTFLFGLHLDIHNYMPKTLGVTMLSFSKIKNTMAFFTFYSRGKRGTKAPCRVQKPRTHPQQVVPMSTLRLSRSQDQVIEVHS